MSFDIVYSISLVYFVCDEPVVVNSHILRSIFSIVHFAILLFLMTYTSSHILYLGVGITRLLEYKGYK